MGVYIPTGGGGGGMPLAWTAPSPNSIALETNVAGDTQQRFEILADGSILWGPGNAGQNAEIRGANGVLTFFTNGNLSGSGYAFELQQSGPSYYLGSQNNNGPWYLSAGPSNTICLQLNLNADVNMNPTAAATTDTSGFFFIRTCAGAPTGVPSVYTGNVPLRYDTTNHKLWIYDAGWKGVVVA